MKILANRVPYLKPDIIEKFSNLTVFSEDGHEFQFNALVLASWSNFWKNLLEKDEKYIESYVVYTNMSRSDVNSIRSFVMRGVLPCSEEDIKNGKLSKILNKKFQSFGIDLHTIVTSIHSKFGTESTNPLMRSGGRVVSGIRVLEPPPPPGALFKHSIFGDDSDYHPNIRSSDTNIRTISKAEHHKQPTGSVNVRLKPLKNMTILL